MSVKIRLKRLGKVRVPQYRIVVVDSRKKRDGKVIEEVGLYRPKEQPSFISVESERVQYWLGVGAQPSDTVHNILKITGDWQKFKGLPGAEGRLKVADPKQDKLEAFNKALAEAHSESGAAAVTPSKKEKEPAEKAPAEKAEEKAPESADEASKAEAETSEA